MDRKEKIVKIAQSVIMNYLKNNYSDRENFEKELQRINKIFEEINISFENIIPGSNTRATNHGNGKITLRFRDKENVSDEEITNMIASVVHEIYHSISKYGMGKSLLEEGYVTYITAETMRYTIDNPIEISGMKTEELRKVLQNQDLENGHIHDSEFVRSTQLVMEQYGIDSSYEYIFNGTSRLIECAYQISQEFGKIIKLQNRKAANSPMLLVERKFFEKAFKEIDYLDISPTLVEMNRLLQKYLIRSKEINKNQRVYEIVSRFNLEGVAYEEFYLEAKKLSDDEIFAKIYDGLPKEPIKYQQHEDAFNATRQMWNIAKMYRQSSSFIKPATYGGINFYSILIAYDMFQKGIKEPSKDDIMKYCKHMIYDTNLEKITVHTVSNYMEYVRTKCSEGKDLTQILNENLANNTVLAINMRKTNELELPQWDKVNKMANMISYQHAENQENFYYFFYGKLLEMQQEQKYGMEEYDEFIAQMQAVFDRILMPETMSEIGCTPEMIFAKTVLENLDISSEDFPQKVNGLLKIINEKNPNLGTATGRLDDLGHNIWIANELLKKSGNQELLEEFSRNLIISFYGKGYNSILKQATAKENRNRNGQTNYDTNTNIEKTVKDIISTPEFYQNLSKIKEMFDRYPHIYERIFETKEFKEMLLKQLPENLQTRTKELTNGCVTMVDIRNAVLGCRFPDISQFTSEKLANFSPLVQFTVKYDTYQHLLKQNKKEEAKKIFVDELVVEQPQNKIVLDRATVVSMAKRTDVQICQPIAHEAFEEVDVVITEKNQTLEGKNIS